MTKRKWLIVAGVVVIAGLFVALGLNKGTQAQHFTAKVERGDIHDVVEATGTINSVITVQVGSQVSGTIAKLNADFNSRVHKGDVVALIDPALFKGALLQATADLENAQANLEAARANLEKAKAALVQTKADYDRAVGLTKDGVMSQQQLDLAKSNYEAANASVGAAAANITQAEAQISLKEGCGRGGANQSRLHRDSLSDRRHRGGAQCGCRANRGRILAGADDFYDRAGSHQDVGVCQDRRVGRGQHQGRQASHLQSGCASQGNFSRASSARCG